MYVEVFIRPRVENALTLITTALYRTPLIFISHQSIFMQKSLLSWRGKSLSSNHPAARLICQTFRPGRKGAITERHKLSYTSDSHSSSHGLKSKGKLFSSWQKDRVNGMNEREEKECKVSHKSSRKKLTYRQFLFWTCNQLKAG